MVKKFTAQLVVWGLSHSQGQDYDETFALVVYFNSLCLLWSIVAANSFVPYQLDMNTAPLYSEVKETI
jgi:hypothetical protein